MYYWNTNSVHFFFSWKEGTHICVHFQYLFGSKSQILDPRVLLKRWSLGALSTWAIERQQNEERKRGKEEREGRREEGREGKREEWEGDVWRRLPGEGRKRRGKDTSQNKSLYVDCRALFVEPIQGQKSCTKVF